MTAKIRRWFFGEKGTLSSFIFHGLLKDQNEIDRGAIYPHQPMTVSAFRQFVEFYLEKGYVFVSPDDILAGLKLPGRYALITFDDGYYNNVNALPVMKEFAAPATFFPTMSNVEGGRSFWWDIIWRERSRRGAARNSIFEENGSMESKTWDEIEKHVRESFGDGAFLPVGDVDRPFTERELKAFAGEKLVSIGNHAMDHVPLTNYGPREIERQIALAQAKLTALAGRSPLMISYPHGRSSVEVIELSKRAGLKLGITVNSGKDILPLKDLFAIRRFPGLTSSEDMREQCARLGPD